jgi:lipopolysaccharide heptosyltransferase I
MVRVSPDVKILVIRLSAIGDVVNTMPSVSLLKQCLPDAKLTWLVEDKAKDIPAMHKYINSCIIFRKQYLLKLLKNPFALPEILHYLLNHITNIRRQNFHLAFDFQGNLKSGLHLLLCGARTKIGFDKNATREFAHIFSNVKVAVPQFTINRVEKYATLLKVFDVQFNHADYNIKIPESAIANAGKFLSENSIKEFIIIHPGVSKRGHLKMWMPERYAKLIDRINQTRLKTVLTYTDGEEGLIKNIKSMCNTNPVIVPKMSLQEFAGLVKFARAFVGSDTGPLHLANAVGTPCVGLYGPKDPAVYAPYGKNHKVIYKKIECSPCRVKKCQTHDCMWAITVEDVFLAIKQVCNL